MLDRVVGHRPGCERALVEVALVGQELESANRQPVEVSQRARHLADIVLEVSRGQQRAARQASHHHCRRAERPAVGVDEERPRRGIRVLRQHLEQSELANADGRVRTLGVVAVATHHHRLALAPGGLEPHDVNARGDTAMQRPHAYHATVGSQRVADPLQGRRGKTLARTQRLSG